MSHIPHEPSSFFATTRWSIINKAACGEDTKVSEGLSEIFIIYWSPLYRYVRRQGHSAPDAEDLVQGFFAHLLVGNGLRLVERERGRFRAFLLGSLKNYIRNEWQRAHAAKRGGFIQHLSLDWESAEQGLELMPSDKQSPDQLFDKEWAMALLERVLHSLESGEGGKEFARWTPFLSLSRDRIPYAQVAQEHGITEGAARVAVHRARRRYRHRLRAEIARTLLSEQFVDQEMQALFAALSV